MKILSALQIRDADQYTIKNEPISSVDLMERAAAVCFNWIIDKYPVSRPVKIFCGTGNNGGDGVAIARMLSQLGYQTEIFVVRFSGKTSLDFDIQLNKIKLTTNILILDIDTLKDLPAFEKNELLIDAIFGTGLSRPASGLAAEVIRVMNQSGNEIISIDVPSGMFCESNEIVNPADIIRATYTLSFESPRLAFLLADVGENAGEWHILPIGLDSSFIRSQNSSRYLITVNLVKTILPTRNRFAHKGTFGHAFLLAGSVGKAGASILSAKSVLRSGAGLLTMKIPYCNYAPVQTAIPEAMVIPDKEEFYITEAGDLSKYSAVGLGPGIGTHNETAQMLKILIQNAKNPIILDADALNILSENKTWLSFLPPNTILTPHPGEFDRLFGKFTSAFSRLEKQLEMAVRFGIIIVLKGAHTSVALPDGTVYFNTTGNHGMATAGSGDVLTGIILGFLAQGLFPADAAIAGVYLHGLAGDIGTNRYSQYALIASDITESIGAAFTSIFSRS